MPIRFRCPHCTQLLGIARRKAGSMVRCPSCHTEVEVPATDELPAADPAPPGAPPPPMPPPALFERDDFEDLLNAPPSLEGGRSRHHPLPTQQPSRPQPAPVLEQNGWRPAVVEAEAIPAGGVVLSPARATVLTVVVILLLAVAFALGLLVGRFLL